MSNFTGVTFAEQNVRPSDDAIIRRQILSDGVLYGCELSYSGSTLTMGAGQLLACGRQFENPAPQNWAVVDATSGFARLVLAIDLTRTATESTFDQVQDYIQYATALDGFPALNQSDINSAGTMYQIVVCVVSLGTGGITGIVSDIGESAVWGGNELVWESATPSSDFPGQTIPLNLKGVEYIMIDSVSTPGAIIVRNSSSGVMQLVVVNKSDTNKTIVQITRRLVTVSDTGVSFADAFTTMYTTSSGKFNDTSVSNSSAKPFRIWIMKGVKA